VVNLLVSLAWALPALERFHRRNGQIVQYDPPEATTWNRGSVSGAVEGVARTVTVRINHEPRLEEVTAFGDPSQHRAGRLLIIMVLPTQLTPNKGGSFTLIENGGRRYDILAVTPLERANRVIRWDCLCGVE
jgi:hypothetical protein